VSARPVLRLKRKETVFPAAPERQMAPLDAAAFHFVWVEGRRAPRHRHATEESARRELDRLREALPGQQVHMFRAEKIDV